MARKNKRAHQRKPQRGPGGPVSRTPAALPRPLGVAESAAAVPAARPLPRRGPSPIPLPEQDASIPRDRVPYFAADLRRIGITAAIMFILLIAGSFFIR